MPDDMINFQRNYNIGEVGVEGASFFTRPSIERRSHYAYFACSEEIGRL